MLIITAILLIIAVGLVGYFWPLAGLILAPIITAATLITAAGLENEQIAVATPFVLLTALIAVAVSNKNPDSDQLPQRFARWILLLAVLSLIVGLGFVIFGPWGIFGLIFAVLFLIFSISYALSAKQAALAHIFITINSVVKQNIPLPLALEAAADKNDSASRILRRITKWLVQGYPLSESIKRAWDRCPAKPLAMIAAAERINQLPSALAAITDDIATGAEEKKKLKQDNIFYPLVVMAIIFIIVSLLSTFVLPNTIAMLKDMSGEIPILPLPTRLLYSIVSFIIYDNPAFFIISLIFLLLVIFPLSIRIKLRSRRPEKPYLISRVADAIKWHLPIFHWFEKNYSALQLVEYLSLSLNTGSTVDAAIEGSTKLDINLCFKKRVQDWLTKVTQGQNIARSAAESRLPKPLVWAFDETINPQNTLPILDTLQKFYRTNYSYRVNLARFILWPCVTISMGLLVAFVALAFFLPGIQIIQYLADTVNP